MVVRTFWSHHIPTSFSLQCIIWSLYSLLCSFSLAAQDVVAGTKGNISGELISLEICSPYVPDLTLIDLPGIARVAMRNQPQDIGEQVKCSLLCQPMERLTFVTYLTYSSVLQDIAIIVLGFWTRMIAMLASSQAFRKTVLTGTAMTRIHSRCLPGQHRTSQPHRPRQAVSEHSTASVPLG